MLAEAATHAGAADAEMLVDALLKEAFGGACAAGSRPCDLL